MLLFKNGDHFEFQYVITCILFENTVMRNISLLWHNTKLPSTIPLWHVKDYTSPRIAMEKRIEKKEWEPEAFYYVVVELEEYTFINCYGRPYVSFLYYLKPFQLNMWSGLLVATAFLSAASYRVACESQMFGSKSFSPVLYLVQALLEKGPILPRQIGNQFIFRITVGTWMLMALMATNGYKGLVTTGVLAPPPKVNEFTHLNDLVAHEYGKPKFVGKLFANLDTKCLHKWQNSTVPKSMKMAVFVSRHTCGTEIMSRVRDESIFKWFARVMHNRRSGKKTKYTFFEKIFDDRLFWIAPNRKSFKNLYDSAVESEIVHCDDNIVLVGKRNFIEKEHAYLSMMYATKTFYVSKDKTATKTVTWQFEHPKGSDILQKFVGLIENGIYIRVKVAHETLRHSGTRINFSRKNNNEKVVKSLPMTSNVQMLFYVCGIFVVFSSVVIAMEEILRNKIAYWFTLQQFAKYTARKTKDFKIACLGLCKLIQSYQ